MFRFYRAAVATKLGRTAILHLCGRSPSGPDWPDATRHDRNVVGHWGRGNLTYDSERLQASTVEVIQIDASYADSMQVGCTRNRRRPRTRLHARVVRRSAHDAGETE